MQVLAHLRKYFRTYTLEKVLVYVRTWASSCALAHLKHLLTGLLYFWVDRYFVFKWKQCAQQTHYQYSTGLFWCSTFFVQLFLYSSRLTPKSVQHILAPIKQRVHNGAIKSRGQFNYILSTLLVTVFYTAPLSNRIRLVQHFLSTAQVRGVQ